MKKKIVAIDLHGTLLNKNWIISSENKIVLMELFKDLADFYDFYICTGNDYSFVEKYVDHEIRAFINNFILESGCIIYKENKRITLINETTKNKLITLKEILQSLNFDFVKYFAKREASISIFTSDENGGDDPIKYVDKVKKVLEKNCFCDSFYVTWSNVAIDIIPNDFSKWSTLKTYSEDKEIISFIDSYNDKEIATNSDYSFLPKNSSAELINYIRNKNKLVFSLNKFHFIKNHSYQSDLTYTNSVIEGLLLLKKLTQFT